MKISELCDTYLEGEITAIGLIRSMSGAFNPDHAVALLTLICAVTRVEDGDLDKDTFRRITR